jgi:tetratricopeptide (TPR) repeat protein
VLQSEIVGARDAHGRARAAYRMGQIYERRLDQLPRARVAYEQAADLAPELGAAHDGVLRVRTRLEQWAEVADGLCERAERSPPTAIEDLMRAGDIYAHRLEQVQRAIRCFQAVRSRDPNNLDALVALEPLHRKAGSFADLAEVLAAQAQVIADPRARVVALEELARVGETRNVLDEAELRRTYGAILGIDPVNRLALAGLERIALARGNGPLLADVDSRLARSQSDRCAAAMHYARLGQSLEAQSPPAALNAFRAALDHDADCYSAMRGLCRAAERIGDARALVDAYQREASWTHDGERAATLLVKSAEVRLEKLGDAKAAIDDAERALERDSDNADAARTLSSLLSQSGEIDRLVSRLTRAASCARGVQRSAALWRDVALLYADAKNDVTAAISCLERLPTSHDDVDTSELLASLYVRGAQWQQARDRYARALSFKPGRLRVAAIELARARVFAHKLNDRRAALTSLEAVLAIDPRSREALQLAFDLNLAARDLAAVRALAPRLQAGANVEGRTAIAIAWGELERGLGHTAEAAAALRDAVVLQGPRGAAAEAYRSLLRTGEWDKYAVMLAEHLHQLKSGGTSGDIRAAYADLARVQLERLDRADEAVLTLRAGIAACAGDARTVAELTHQLAACLSHARRFDEAIVEYQQMVQRDVASIEAWRGLSRAYSGRGLKLEAGIAAAGLVLFGAADDIERVLARQKRQLAGAGNPGSVGAEVIASISAAPDRQLEAKLCALLSALAETLAKLYPPDLDSYGVSARERIVDPQHPLSRMMARVAPLFGLVRCDVYLHRSVTTDVVAELGEPAILMVPAFALDLTEAQQAFKFARAIAALTLGAHAVPTLGRRELSKTLVAALRCVAPHYGADRYDEAELADLHKRLMRAMPRRAKKPVELAAGQCLADPSLDFDRWAASLELTTARVATVLANDLPEVIDLLRRSRPDTATLDVARFVSSSQVATDVVAFWASEPAIALRRRVGIV